MAGLSVKVRTSLLGAAAAIALSGCGGGSGGGAGTGTAPAAASISGRLMDGYLVGAKVFWDCNDNYVPDAGEEVVVTSAGGRYTIGAAPSGTCPLHAFVPSTAIDESTGQAVGLPYRMSAMAGTPTVINPWTTAVSLGFGAIADLQAKFPSTVSVYVGSDYIAAGASGAQIHHASRFLSVALQAIDGVVAGGDTETRKAAAGLAVSLVPATAYRSIDASELDGFRTALASVNVPYAASVTLDKAEFTLVEGAFGAPGDPRRAIVQQALETIRAYPDAISGNVVNWSLVPRAVRSPWSTQLVDGQNGFSDSQEVRAIQTVLRAAQQQAQADINAESAKVVRKMATVLAKSAANMTITSLDSAVKVLPTASVLARGLKVTKVRKLKAMRTVAWGALQRIQGGVSFAADCAGATQDLVYVDTFVDYAQPFDLVNAGTSLAKCVAGILNADAMSVIAEGVAAGRAYYEGSREGDILKAAEAIGALSAALLDLGEQPVASAIVGETVLLFLTRTTALNELNKTGNRAQADFDAAVAVIQASFTAILDAGGSAIINARLAPYIRPRHLINIGLPRQVEVGQDVVTSIDQRLGQPIAYRLVWGLQVDGTAVAADSTWTSSGGSTSLPAVRYRLPGTYNVRIEVSDNSFGFPIAPFQILTQTIEVACPSGTAPDPDGTCRAVAGANLVAPASAQIGWEREFVVSGVRFPATAVVSVQDAYCSATYGRTSTTLKVTCTLSGVAGPKRVTVKTDTLANNGTVITDNLFVDAVASRLYGIRSPDFAMLPPSGDPSFVFQTLRVLTQFEVTAGPPSSVRLLSGNYVFGRTQPNDITQYIEVTTPRGTRTVYTTRPSHYVFPRNLFAADFEAETLFTESGVHAVKVYAVEDVTGLRSETLSWNVDVYVRFASGPAGLTDIAFKFASMCLSGAVRVPCSQSTAARFGVGVLNVTPGVVPRLVLLSESPVLDVDLRPIAGDPFNQFGIDFTRTTQDVLEGYAVNPRTGRSMGYFRISGDDAFINRPN